MAASLEEQRSQIIELIHQEQLSREDIASRVGVSPGTVSAIKAHMTMETYTKAGLSETRTDELIEAPETTFALERDLQRVLRSHIQQLEPGLQIIDNDKERTTDAGRMDITAKDAQETVVVIELKAGTAAPEALTQLLAYMGAVETQDQKPVRGMLIASDFHPRVVFAVRTLPNVQLLRYHFKFTFESIE